MEHQYRENSVARNMYSTIIRFKIQVYFLRTQTYKVNYNNLYNMYLQKKLSLINFQTIERLHQIRVGGGNSTK